MLLKKGSTGAEVGIIQNNLKMLGYDPLTIDCIFGDNTESAVKKFQSYYGLNSDGIVGCATWSKLISKIKEIQTALNHQGYDLIIDGIAGLNTYTCLLEFQRLNNFVVDGIVGPATRSKLFSSQIPLKSENSHISSNTKTYDISAKGINFIADYENFYAEPYRGLDSQNQTIGYGHVIMKGESFTKLTETEAKDLLKKDLDSFVHLVNTFVIGLNLSQNQFDALISFSYNCGVTALQGSTLLKDIKDNASLEKIKEDFMMWVKCNGKTSLGLQRRRNDEYKIYANADYTRTYPTF